MKLRRIASSIVVVLLLVSMFGVMMVYAPPPSPMPTIPVESNVFVTNEAIDVTLDEPIEITNPSGESLDVVVTNTPAFQPFQDLISFWIEGGATSRYEYWMTIPQGKMLVIEFASADCSNDNGQNELLVDIGTIVDGNSVNHCLGSLEPSTTGAIYSSISKEVKIYADPETTVSVTITRPASSTGDAYITVTVSGYLTDTV